MPTMNKRLHDFLVALNADYHRLQTSFTLWRFLITYLFSETYSLIIWFRVCSFASVSLWLKPVFFIGYMMLRKNQRRTGIHLSYHVRIGPGLKIVHSGITYINSAAVIGSGCTMMHNVTIGVSRAEDKRVAIIGDNVFIGPNVVILGDVKIGNNATIGANCVVTKDFPDDAVIVGVPGINIRADQSSTAKAGQ